MRYGAVGAVAVLVLVAFVGVVVNATHVEHRTCTVEDKDRTTVTTVTDGQSSTHSDMRVYTKQCGVLSVGDSWLDFTFSSSDTYSKMKIGKTYRVKTRGYRVPFLSMFPNVTEATPIT